MLELICLFVWNGMIFLETIKDHNLTWKFFFKTNKPKIGFFTTVFSYTGKQTSLSLFRFFISVHKSSYFFFFHFTCILYFLSFNYLLSRSFYSFYLPVYFISQVFFFPLHSLFHFITQILNVIFSFSNIFFLNKYSLVSNLFFFFH